MATKDFMDYSPASGSNNGSIDITVPRNPQMNPRTSAISVEGGGISKSVNITQLQNSPLSIINKEGTTNFGGAWDFPPMGYYEIGSTARVEYVSPYPQVTESAVIGFGGNKITKIEVQDVNNITFQFSASDNAILIKLNDATSLTNNSVAIWSEGNSDTPWMILEVYVTQQ